MNDYSLFFLLIAAMIFAMWAQVNVNSTFTKYSKVNLYSGMTGFEAARKILDSHGLYSVSISRVSGNLSDHYDPRSNCIRLSEAVYDSCSASAVGVAAHEAGHAIQHAEGYFPIKLRSAIIPVCQIGSNLSWPLILCGFLFSFYPLTIVGIALFSLATVFQLVTLPCEFDASARALKSLETVGLLRDNELAAASKTLRAAALTYVAALAVSLINLLRIISIFGRRRD